MVPITQESPPVQEADISTSSEVEPQTVADSPCAETKAAASTSPIQTGLSSHTEPYNEFNYKPVPVLAVVGLILALISSMGVLVWLVMPLCLIAFGISTMAFISIRRSQGGYGGTRVALAGMLLSLTFTAAGIGQQLYTFRTEVPEGYERVNFLRDISKKGFVEKDGMASIHPDVEALEGQKIFLKGYIYQTGRTENLTSFLMVKDNQDCCFGANPALTDRVGVIMQDGKSIDYHAGKVAISGTFRLNPDYNPENQLAPVYIVEGEIFSKWVSDFN